MALQRNREPDVGRYLLKMVVLVALLFISSANAILYRPNLQLRMKNTSLLWNKKALARGPNVCAEETLWDPLGSITYDAVWTAGSLCLKSAVRFECCEGYAQYPGDRGCTVIKDLENTTDAASRLSAAWFMHLLSSSGMDAHVAETLEKITVLAPLDDSVKTLSSQFRWLTEESSSRATRLLNAPLFVLSHVLPGRMNSKNMRNDLLLTPLSGQPIIRINQFPNGLTTANCVPLAKRNVETQNVVINTIVSSLPQNHLFTITDIVLRDVHARLFANFLVQSRLETLLRSEGPFTLFLPSDSAINSLDHTQLHAIRSDPSKIEALVLNHVVSGVQCFAVLRNAVVPTRLGTNLRSKCHGSGVRINDAEVTSSDKMATNGVVHVIDKLLLPHETMLLPDLLKSLGLTDFLNLIDRAGLRSTLSAVGSTIVFAPTNKALQGATALNEQEARVFVLNHLGSTKTSSLTVSSKGNRAPFSIKYLRNNKRLVDAAAVSSADNEGLNGVVHIVDRPLVPPNKKTVLQFLQDDGRFHYFLDSFRSTGLSVYSKLNMPNQKTTVFAVPDSSISYSLYYRPGVLLNHVVDKVVFSEEVPENGRYQVNAQSGSQLNLLRRGEAFFVGSSSILQRDILCADGVVHIVGDVIIA